MFDLLSLSSKKGFDVRSYGTGSVVKLPGPGPEQPNIYEFGTTYQFMYEDLHRKDPHLYLLSTYSSVANALQVLVERLKMFVLFCVSIVLLWKCSVVLADLTLQVHLERASYTGLLNFVVSGRN